MLLWMAALAEKMNCCSTTVDYTSSFDISSPHVHGTPSLVWKSWQLENDFQLSSYDRSTCFCHRSGTSKTEYEPSRVAYSFGYMHYKKGTKSSECLIYIKALFVFSWMLLKWLYAVFHPQENWRYCFYIKSLHRVFLVVFELSRNKWFALRRLIKK